MKHRLPTAPLASGLRGAGGGAVDNPALEHFNPQPIHLSGTKSCSNNWSHLWSPPLPVDPSEMNYTLGAD